MLHCAGILAIIATINLLNSVCTDSDGEVLMKAQLVLPGIMVPHNERYCGGRDGDEPCIIHTN